MTAVAVEKHNVSVGSRYGLKVGQSGGGDVYSSIGHETGRAYGACSLVEEEQSLSAVGNEKVVVIKSAYAGYPHALGGRIVGLFLCILIELFQSESGGTEPECSVCLLIT